MELFTMVNYVANKFILSTFKINVTVYNICTPVIIIFL